MVTSDRPQTGIWWLRKGSKGPDLLGQMARGEIDIRHDALRTHTGREGDYLRNLLVALGILEPWDPHIARFTVWLETDILPTLPQAHADVIRQYGRWHVQRNLHERARHGQLTQMLANSARVRIRSAVEFLDLLTGHDATIQTATQAHLEHFLIRPGYNRTAAIAGFVAWLRKTRINTDLTTPWTQRSAPPVTVSDDQRWNDVERLLHDDTIRLYARIGGLLTLLFAQPLVRIVAMRTDQVELTDHAVHVTFAGTPIQMPPILDDLLREHTTRRGQSLYVSRDTGWLFPGGQPGLHLATENIRRDLVAVGIKPYENRKAALFQLAANVPAPILSDLLGTTDANAAAWAKLAARDWSAYIQHRTGE